MNRNICVTVSRTIDELLIVVVVAVITIEKVLVLAGDSHDLGDRLWRLSGVVEVAQAELTHTYHRTARCTAKSANH